MRGRSKGVRRAIGYPLFQKTLSSDPAVLAMLLSLAVNMRPVRARVGRVGFKGGRLIQDHSALVIQEVTYLVPSSSRGTVEAVFDIPPPTSIRKKRGSLASVKLGPGRPVAYYSKSGDYQYRLHVLHRWLECGQLSNYAQMGSVGRLPGSCREFPIPSFFSVKVNNR